jgi:predicted RNase H-like nuclease
MITTIIGIDCATQDDHVGLALAHFDGQQAQVDQVLVGSKQAPILETITHWITQTSTTLIALDAPLGWPAELGPTLSSHNAGDLVDVDPDRLFRRLTDRIVQQEIKKLPLEVGANLIARTAHAALKLLHQLRKYSDIPIPLAWSPVLDGRICAIEVYPAATLLAYAIPMKVSPSQDKAALRQQAMVMLSKYIHFPSEQQLMIENGHAFDASICVLAAADFLRGQAIAPTDLPTVDLPTVKKEGWIWLKKSLRTDL